MRNRERFELMKEATYLDFIYGVKVYDITLAGGIGKHPTDLDRHGYQLPIMTRIIDVVLDPVPY